MDMVRLHVDSPVLEREVGKEMTIVLNDSQIDSFSMMLKELELLYQSRKITFYSIASPSIEDVFMQYVTIKRMYLHTFLFQFWQ